MSPSDHFLKDALICDATLAQVIGYHCSSFLPFSVPHFLHVAVTALQTAVLHDY